VPVSGVRLDVIAYAPTVFYHCQHCEIAFQNAGLGDRVHHEQAEEGLPADLQAEYAEVSDWIHRIVVRYGRRLRVRLIDAASVEGVWKSLRHKIRRYPAAVVAGRHVHVGADLWSLEPMIERELAAGEQGGDS
jgi:hypothetical protein